MCSHSCLHTSSATQSSVSNRAGSAVLDALNQSETLTETIEAQSVASSGFQK